MKLTTVVGGETDFINANFIDVSTVYLAFILINKLNVRSYSHDGKVLILNSNYNYNG